MKAKILNSAPHKNGERVAIIQLEESNFRELFFALIDLLVLPDIVKGAEMRIYFDNEGAPLVIKTLKANDIETEVSLQGS